MRVCVCEVHFQVVVPVQRGGWGGRTGKDEFTYYGVLFLRHLFGRHDYHIRCRLERLPKEVQRVGTSPERPANQRRDNGRWTPSAQKGNGANRFSKRCGFSEPAAGCASVIGRGPCYRAGEISWWSFLFCSPKRNNEVFTEKNFSGGRPAALHNEPKIGFPFRVLWRIFLVATIGLLRRASCTGVFFLFWV